MEKKFWTNASIVGLAILVFAILIIALAGCRNRNGNGGMSSTPKPQTTQGRNIYVPSDYPTINQALQNATAGDVVKVNWSSGPFSEATGEKFPLVIPRGVTLEGEGRFRPLIDMDSANQLPILALGDDVTVLGFAFSSTSGQMPAVLQAQGIRNVLIRWCKFYVRSGLSFDGSRGVTVEQNVFDSYPKPGVSGAPLLRALKITTSEDVVVRNNTFSAFAENIYVLQSQNTVVDRNIIVGASGQGGLVVDDVSFATMSITENLLWKNREGMWNFDRSTPFFPATGGNLSADPLFVNREEPGQGVYESSPTHLAGGIIIGYHAGGLTLAETPTFTKGAGSTTVIQPFGSGSIVFPHMKVVLSPILLAPQLRLWVEVDTNIPDPFELRLRDMVTQDVLAEEDKNAPLRPAIRTLVLQDSGINPFPYVVNKDLELFFEIWMQARAFTPGEYITLKILSMEWIYGQGNRVNDGFTPRGLPITHTVTKL